MMDCAKTIVCLLESNIVLGQSRLEKTSVNSELIRRKRSLHGSIEKEQVGLNKMLSSDRRIQPLSEIEIEDWLTSIP